jgi:tetratricopeptide (TPR) repeat protein
MFSNKNYHKAIIGVIFILGIFFVQLEFKGAEGRIYFGLTESVFNDGDLNIINNHANTARITKTYHYPNFHNHGGVIIWIYFYGCGRFLDRLLQTLNSYAHSPLVPADTSFVPVMMCLSTYVIGLATLYLTFFLLKHEYGARIVLLSIALLFWGTPYFLYMFFLPGQANILASFFSVTLIVVLLKSMTVPNLSYWFITGMLFSIGAVVKLDLWFHGMTIFSLLCVRLIHDRNLKKGMLICVSFLSGVVPVWALKMTNDYLTFGEFKVAETSLINGNYSFFFDMLFSPYRGYIFSSPIFIFSFLGGIIFIYRIIQHKEHILAHHLPSHALKIIMLCYAITLICKLMISSRGYAWGGGTFGARQYLSEFPLVTFLFCEFYTYFKRKKLLILTSIPLVFWNIFLGLNFVYQSPPQPPVTIKEHLAEIYQLLTGPGFLIYMQESLLSSISLFFKLALIVFILCVLLIVYCIFIKMGLIKKVESNFVLYFTWFCFVTYFLITMSNVVFHKKNVMNLLRNGYFNHSRIISSHEIVAGENLASMDEMLDVYSRWGNKEMVAAILKTKQAYLNNMRAKILSSSDTSWEQLEAKFEALLEQRQYAEALKVAEEALAVAEKTFGPEHPNVARSLHNKAILLLAQGRLAEAEPLFKRTLTIYENTLDPAHPVLVTPLHNLAFLYARQGRYAEAETHVKRALAIQENALGANHPRMAELLKTLAFVYTAQGRYAEAEPLFKRILSIYEQFLPPDHPEVSGILENMRELYRKLGKEDEIQKLQERYNKRARE